MQGGKSTKGINQFEPTILDSDAIKDFAYQNKQRLLLSACDIDYLEKHFECLVTYKNSRVRIPYLVLILQERDTDTYALYKKQQNLREKLNCNKIFFGFFTCDALATIKDELGAATYKLYRTNYIRCARFIMVRKIWKLLGINKQEKTISEACTYIMDFDNYVFGDFNHSAKIQYGAQKAIFCWDSSVSVKADFPISLSSFSNSPKGLKLSFSYKIIKAGFVALSPSSLTNTILQIIEFHSIGPKFSDLYHKLICFYYGDQISILNALRDIKDESSINYHKYIGWIDASSSQIACLSKNQNASIFMPKGID